MRAIVIVLDSVGIGGAPDAAAYGDAGADTLGHLLDYGFLKPQDLPNLWSLGLGQILNRDPCPRPVASYGRMREVSAGKDSTTGHWELAGVILDEPFAVFERFPPAIVDPIEAEANVCFIGNVAASGTEIIERLGPEHLRTGRPILYTSADSVLQIAAHEEVIPVERLYDICRIARRHADAWRIGRVIARPFVGTPGYFTRTAHRHDFSMRPPRTVLDALTQTGHPVISIGKIADLFAGEGITESHPTESNADGMRRIDAVWSKISEWLVFANLVDFDQVFGHRRDPTGYAAALVEFDLWLGSFLPMCADEDLLIITADHGNDPTFRGTDHTREQVPLLVRYMGRAESLGVRASFTDVAATLSTFFDLDPAWPIGSAFVPNERQVREAPVTEPRNDENRRGCVGSALADAEPHGRACMPKSREPAKRHPDSQFEKGVIPHLRKSRT